MLSSFLSHVIDTLAQIPGDLVALTIFKVFLEDFVTTYGRLLTVEAITISLSAIDDILVDEALNRDSPMTPESIRSRVEQIAESLTNSDWNRDKQRKAISEIVETFDYDIFLRKYSETAINDAPVWELGENSPVDGMVFRPDSQTAPIMNAFFFDESLDDESLFNDLAERITRDDDSEGFWEGL